MLGGTRQLRQRDHGNVQLPRHRLQPSADVARLDHPVAFLRLLGWHHQLEVVHDDEVDPAIRR